MLHKTGMLVTFAKLHKSNAVEIKTVKNDKSPIQVEGWAKKQERGRKTRPYVKQAEHKAGYKASHEPTVHVLSVVKLGNLQSDKVVTNAK